MSDRRRLPLLRALFFLSHVPIGLTLPFLGLWWRDTLHFSEGDIGRISAMSSLTMIIVSQLWGYLSDVAASRKKLIVINSVASAAVFFSIVQVRTYWAAVGMMLLFQVFNSSLAQMLHGLLLSHDDGDRRFGGLRALSSLGFVVANLLVGYVADKLMGGQLWFIFPAMAAAYIASALLTLPLREPPKDPHHERLSFLSVQKHFLRKPEVVLFLIFVFVYNSAHALSYSFLAFLLKDLGADNRFIAACYSGAAILELPVFFASGWFIRRYGVLRLTVFCAVLQSLRWAGVWASTSKWHILMLNATHCITFAVFFACTVQYMNHAAGPRLKASAQTLLSLVSIGLASVLSSYLGSAMRDGWAEPYARSFVTNLGLTDLGPLHNLYVCNSAIAAFSVLLWIAFAVAHRRLHGPHDPLALPVTA